MCPFGEKFRESLFGSFCKTDDVAPTRVRWNGIFPFTPSSLEAVDDVEPMRRRAGEGLPESSVTTGVGDGDTTRWRRRAILDGLRRLAVFVALFLVVEFLRRWHANEAMTAWAESGSGKEKIP